MFVSTHYYITEQQHVLASSHRRGKNKGPVDGEILAAFHQPKYQAKNNTITVFTLDKNMAKTAKPKKRDISLHSRAARRGASPPSKDLLVKKSSGSAEAGGKKEESDYKPWLHSTQTGGISKSKNKKAKQLTRQQKVRAQKALEKADAVAGKHETKVRDSKARSKRVQNRAKMWEELNANAGVGGVAGEGGKKVQGKGNGNGGGVGEEVWEDVEEDGDVGEGGEERVMDVETEDVEALGVADGGAEQTSTGADAEDEDIDEVT
ncbi:hypothetical protein LTR78_000681 [Recurvomyces mirabilis]|uniref:Uncharacterized protein n=1 Tax=Recurvomyces mirabilis TaxID=574656 RepID=A0AAE0WYC5_9PEZI|nr:hypothetical protein LTR78_000681 [Recurvomyces mirabilis]KAK5162335.1 hypothetical protein LTS14_000682 [Recurvomyces mirabilis]